MARTASAHFQSRRGNLEKLKFVETVRLAGAGYGGEIRDAMQASL